MTAIVTALGAVAWLFFVLLGVGLAQAAARGDLALARALEAERERSAEDERLYRRAA
jgi:hypothetical protein